MHSCVSVSLCVLKFPIGAKAEEGGVGGLKRGRGFIKVDEEAKRGDWRFTDPVHDRLIGKGDEGRPGRYWRWIGLWDLPHHTGHHAYADEACHP